MSTSPYITSLSLNVSSDSLSAPLTMSIPINGLTYSGSNSIQISNSEIVTAFSSANEGQQFSSSLVTTYGGLILEVAGFEGLSNIITSSPYIYTPVPLSTPVYTDSPSINNSGVLDIDPTHQISYISKIGGGENGYSAVTTEGGLTLPTQLALNSDGDIIICCTSAPSNKLQIFDSNGNFKFKVGGSGSGDDVVTGCAVFGLAVDKNDNIYVAWNNDIKVFSKTGVFKSKVTLDITPYSIIFDKNNRMFVLDTTNNITSYTINSNNIFTKLGLSKHVGYAGRLLINSLNNLVLYSPSQANIATYDINDLTLLSTVSIPRGTGDGEVNNVGTFRLIFNYDSNGNMVFTEYESNTSPTAENSNSNPLRRIQYFDSDFNFKRSINFSNGYGVNSSEGNYFRIYSMVVHPSGDLLVSDTLNNRVLRYGYRST
jgi:hypothetical protein